MCALCLSRRVRCPRFLCTRRGAGQPRLYTTGDHPPSRAGVSRLFMEINAHTHTRHADRWPPFGCTYIGTIRPRAVNYLTRVYNPRRWYALGTRIVCGSLRACIAIGVNRIGHILISSSDYSFRKYVIIKKIYNLIQSTTCDKPLRLNRCAIKTTRLPITDIIVSYLGLKSHNWFHLNHIRNKKPISILCGQHGLETT